MEGKEAKALFVVSTDLLSSEKTMYNSSDLTCFAHSVCVCNWKIKHGDVSVF